MNKCRVIFFSCIYSSIAVVIFTDITNLAGVSTKLISKWLSQGVMRVVYDTADCSRVIKLLMHILLKSFSKFQIKLSSCLAPMHFLAL